MSSFESEPTTATEAAYGSTLTGRSHDLPVAQRIKYRLQEHERAAQKLRALMELLDKNPAIAEFIDLSRGVL